jgi:hypothetical protein
MHLMMLKGTLDTGTDGEAMDKETWEMDDYRKMALWLSLWLELLEEQPLTGMLLEEGLTVKQNANEEFR